MGPKVSIIIVTYNAEKLIHSAIKSVIAQTYSNKELIIVDGASTDNTVQIIKGYADTIPYLTWQSAPDKGVYDAMNKGIAIATGEWLYFLGADDFLINDAVLNVIFGSHLHQDCDLLYGDVKMSSKNKIYDGPFDKNKILFKNICHQAVFYKKTLHNSVGLYALNYKSLADWHLNIRCFFNSSIRIKYIPLLIAHFTTGGISKQHTDIAFFREVLFPFNLKQLNSITSKKLMQITFYDRWWRLLRSLQLRGTTDVLKQQAGNEPVPQAIETMFNQQQHLPPGFLKTGITSKFFMALSYCTYLFSRG